jgi:hypothetical protein
VEIEQEMTNGKWKIERCVCYPETIGGETGFPDNAVGLWPHHLCKKKIYNFTVMSAEYDSGCDLDHQTCAKL